MLPSLLLVAVLGTAAGGSGSSSASSEGAAPVVDLTVRHPGR